MPLESKRSIGLLDPKGSTTSQETKRSLSALESKRSASTQDRKRSISTQNPKRSSSIHEAKRSSSIHEPKRSISTQEPMPRLKSRKSSPSVTLGQHGKLSYRLSPLDDALLKFRFISQKYEWLRMPIPVVYDEKKCYTSDYTNEPKIWLSYKKRGHDESLEMAIFRNQNIENSTFAVLMEWQKLYKSITILKLEYCALTSAQVLLLLDLVKTDKSLRDLSLNGNPNDEQNFYILLNGTRLLSLSLKFCGIDVDGIRMISEELSKPMENPLLHLNLASNMIFDEGVEYVTKFLRINRVLVSLNLADNKFRYKGCQQLMEPLQKFCLNQEEIVIMRRIKFELQKKSMLEGSDSISIARKPSKTSKKSLKEKSSHSSQSLRKKSSSSWCPVPETIYHPFIQDVEELDTEFYCKGNNTLTNLNLSYNRIQQEGLQSVINMLDYQINNYANDKGISRISLEGNDVNDLSEIDKLLARKLKSPSINITTTHSSRSRSQNSVNKTQ